MSFFLILLKSHFFPKMFKHVHVSVDDYDNMLVYAQAIFCEGGGWVLSKCTLW